MASKAFVVPPALLENARTFTYKVVSDSPIELDLFSPLSALEEQDVKRDLRVLLFLHGGAWIGGSRHEYSTPLLYEFLKRGYHVVSAEYRLLPETHFITGQLEDIRDLESWLRQTLPEILSVRNRTPQITVAGASAGALLALLTPSLWTQNPAAILSIYGPTDLRNIKYLNKGLLSQMDISKPDMEQLGSALNFTSPPSKTPRPSSAAEWLSPRTMLGMYMFKSNSTAAMLVHGMRQCSYNGPPEQDLCFPEARDVSVESINSISPVHLASQIRYPPTLQILGSEDDLFSPSHLEDFAGVLERAGVAHKEFLVPGASHAFDMRAEIDGNLHKELFCPAIDWLYNVTK